MNALDLKVWLTDKSFSQRELARRLGVHHNTVGNWCSGDTPIDDATELALRQLTDEVTASYTLGEWRISAPANLVEALGARRLDAWNERVTLALEIEDSALRIHDTRDTLANIEGPEAFALAFRVAHAGGLLEEVLFRCGDEVLRRLEGALDAADWQDLIHAQAPRFNNDTNYNAVHSTLRERVLVHRSKDLTIEKLQDLMTGREVKLTTLHLVARVLGMSALELLFGGNQ